MKVIIYDSACALCSRSANFVAARDRAGRFLYGDSESPRARDMLAGRGVDPGAIDSLLLIEDGRTFAGSTAALRIVAGLPLPWRALALLRFVPAALREPVYRLVARNRHRLIDAGACPEPHPRLRERYLG